MPQRVGDILAQRVSTSMVGREREIEALLGLLESESALVVHLHGIAGVGKSTLLTVFTHQAEARGAVVVSLDCRLIEPTERGFVQELAKAIQSDEITAGAVSVGLGALGERVVLVLDTYEVFRLMDTWLRQVFVPLLSDNVRLILAGRQPPVAAWRIAPEWQGLFRSISLGSLDEGEAVELLSRAGLAADQAHRINRHTRGHPLALRLAASAALERTGLELEKGTIQGVVEELSHLFLADVKDAETRKGLEAASMVRRITHSLLVAMLPDSAAQEVYDRLSELPFVERRRDGLRLQDAVHDALSDVLHARDPSRCRDYRQRAWRQLSSEVRGAGIAELWRYTADMLYLIDNPVIREAFFPSGTQDLVVDLPTYAPVAVKLGFRPLADLGAELDESLFHTAMLDFGPASVDGWLAGLAADELGLEERDTGVVVRYEVQEKLGAGGMGVVFRAKDLVLVRPVALKILPRESAEGATSRARFLREVRTPSAATAPPRPSFEYSMRGTIRRPINGRISPPSWRR
ncbi:MAG: AAA family ATPase [Thermoanaerobaculales bacterium]